MSKVPTKQVDQELADELGLILSPFVMTLKHIRVLPKVVQGFVFAFQKDGITYYDTVDAWTETLGLRHKTIRFITHPVIELRIRQRQYQRWYVRDSETLYPVQMAKVDALYDTFYFVSDPDPGYRTQQVFTGDTLFIRKKPLMAMRPLHPGWSLYLDPKRPWHPRTRLSLVVGA